MTLTCSWPLTTCVRDLLPTWFSKHISAYLHYLEYTCRASIRWILSRNLTTLNISLYRYWYHFFVFFFVKCPIRWMGARIWHDTSGLVLKVAEKTVIRNINDMYLKYIFVVMIGARTFNYRFCKHTVIPSPPPPPPVHWQCSHAENKMNLWGCQKEQKNDRKSPLLLSVYRINTWFASPFCLLLILLSNSSHRSLLSFVIYPGLHTSGTVGAARGVRGSCDVSVLSPDKISRDIVSLGLSVTLRDSPVSLSQYL